MPDVAKERCRTPKDDSNMEWVVALAEGFRRAGAKNTPIVPDPKAIEECIRSAMDQ